MPLKSCAPRRGAVEVPKARKSGGGEEETRKMLLALLTVFMVGLLVTPWMPVVQAAKPTTVSGEWCWMAPSASFIVTKVAGGNVFISAVEHDKLSGTLEGTGMGTFTLVVHPAGFNTVKGESHVTVTVEGKSGSLHLGWAGHTMTEQSDWWFHWTILSGTDELQTLRGQGIGFGPGPAGLDLWGCADLSGKIHFAPN